MSATLYFLFRDDRFRVGCTTDPDDHHTDGTTDDVLLTMPIRDLADEKAARRYLARWLIGDKGHWFHWTPASEAAARALLRGDLFGYADQVAADRRRVRRERAQRIATASWERTPDRAARTAPARAALAQRFLDEAGGDEVRAAELRSEHFRSIAKRRRSA